METGDDAKSWQEDVKLAKAIDVDDLRGIAAVPFCL